MNQELKNLSEKLKSVFRELGYEDSDTEEQMSQIGQLINLKYYKKVLQKYPEVSKINPDNLENFLTKKISPEENSKLVQNISKEVVEGYFKAITSGLDDEQKSKLAEKLKDINS